MPMDGAKPFEGGTVFPNAGGSHVTTENDNTHITTEIPGLKQGGQVGIHVPVDDFGNVGEPDPFFNPPKK